MHFGTLDVWYTCWYTKWFFGTLGSFLVTFGTFGTVSTFTTPVSFGTLRIGSVFSTLGIIPGQFWNIWCTLVPVAFGTPVGTLRQLVHLVVFWYIRIVNGHLRYV